MNWAWATSLDQVWRSPDFSMWVALAAAGFFGLVILITLLRADKSLANAALTITTLLAVGVAVAATFGGNGPVGRSSSSETRSASAMGASLPALACVDDLAGDTVLSACEKALFSSAESVAAAVSYAASQLEHLTTYGDVASANKNMTPELAALRRAVERDRYGLIAHVLVENYRCTPADCPAFRLFSNRKQVVANMEAHAFDGVVGRYAASWNAPLPATPAGPPVAVLSQAPGTQSVGQVPPGTPLGPSQGTPLGPSLLTGRPTNADFPTAASTPPVSIMNPEPTAGPPPRSTPPAPTASAPASTVPPPPAKKPPVPKPPHTSAAAAPVQLSPAAAPPPAVARE
jgi:hypothetical protein